MTVRLLVALGEILKGAPASRVTTWGDKRDISIDSMQMK